MGLIVKLLEHSKEGESFASRMNEVGRAEGETWVN